MNQKGIIPIFAIAGVSIFLLVLGIGGYWAYTNSKTKAILIPTPAPIIQFSPAPQTYESSESADWKEYKNTKYGFSIKYPEGWSVDDKETVSQYPPYEIEVASLYPYRVPSDVLAKIQKEEPFAEPGMGISIANTPFSESTGFDKGVFIKEPVKVNISGQTGNYYQIPGAPFSPLMLDLPYENGNKTLNIGVSFLSDENQVKRWIEETNKKYNIELQVITEDTFKKIISTFKSTSL